MKKLNSLIYLFYYLFLWVVLPTTGLGVQVYASEFGGGGNYTITKGDANFSDFQHAVNPDWNRIVRQESQKEWLSATGHWPVLFSSVFNPKLAEPDHTILRLIYSSAPLLGSLTTSKIIFPFHYFW